MKTFGHIAREASGRWVATDVPPHVCIRLKHVFAGLSFGARPPFTISDTLEHAADLSWFLQRYPMTMSADDRAYLELRAKQQAQRLEDVEAILAPEYQPGLLHGFREPEEPLPYQLRAAELFRNTGQCLLVDDVGLGKTVSALAALSDGWGLPAVVVVQPHLAAQWARYIDRFTHLRSAEIKGRSPESLPVADIYIARYSNIAAWIDVLTEMPLRTVIYDEVQELRHGGATCKGRAAQHLSQSVENRLGLTATPIYNYGSELHAVVSAISPGALGTFDEFTTNWCSMMGRHWVVKDPQALGAYMIDSGLMLRRTIESPEVLSTLPPKSRNVIEVDWNEDDVETDRQLQIRLAQRVISGSFTERGRAARELDIMLRQETGVAKARSVASYVRMLAESGEAVLLGGWHRAVYDIWNEMLADLSPVMFTGTETAPQKARSLKAIESGESQLMIMSLRSGSGLDGLQHRVAHAVIGEMDWSPQVHQQFVGRIHRTGQAREVLAHYPFVNGGSDPVIMSALGLKASQSDGIINPFATAQVADAPEDSRMRAVAQSVLENNQGHALEI